MAEDDPENADVDNVKKQLAEFQNILVDILDDDDSGDIMEQYYSLFQVFSLPITIIFLGIMVLVYDSDLDCSTTDGTGSYTVIVYLIIAWLFCFSLTTQYIIYRKEDGLSKVLA